MCFGAVALIAKGGRAYAFTALNGGPNQVGGISRDAFEHWLATVAFTPDAIPTPLPPPPLDASFSSTRNGYSLRYPAGWTAAQADGTAGRSVAPVAGDPGVDVLTGPQLRLSVTSIALDTGVAPSRLGKDVLRSIPNGLVAALRLGADGLGDRPARDGDRVADGQRRRRRLVSARDFESCLRPPLVPRDGGCNGPRLRDPP